MMKHLSLALAALLLVAAGLPQVVPPSVAPGGDASNTTVTATGGTVAQSLSAIAARALGAPQIVSNIAALRASSYAAAVVPAVVNVSGYYALGDGGGGVFQWSASSTSADDGGLVINPTGNSGPGRWLRFIGDRIVSPDFWGAKGDYSSDDTVPVQAAVTYASANGYLLEFRRPRYLVTSISVSSNLYARGKGANSSSIYRITSSDALGTAATGGSLSAGTYRYAVYAYNGSSLLKVQPGAGAVVLDGSSNTAFSVSYASVPTATDYQIYFSSSSSLFGVATYMLDAGSALSANITAFGSVISGGAPRYVDPVFYIASGGFTVNFDDIQINGNGRATHGLYYADFAGGTYPYYYSGISNRIALYGGTINQVYLGNRRFASQFNHSDISGGYDAVYMLNGADHRWTGTDISNAADANLVASGQTNITFTAGNFFFAPVGVRLIGTSNAQFVGGSMDGATLHAWEIDSASSANSAIGTTFSNPAATYDIYNQGLKTTLTAPSFRASSAGAPQYSLYNDTTVDVAVISNPTLFTSGTSSPPYSVAFTNAPAKLSEGMVGSRTLAQPYGYFNQSVAVGLTAVGSTQATALGLSSSINRITAGSSGNGVRLDAPVPGAGIDIYNETASSINLYPASGTQIYSLSVNASYALPSYSVAHVTWVTNTYAEISISPLNESTNTVTGGSARNLYGSGNSAYQGFGAAGGTNAVSNAYGAVSLGINTTADGSFSWARGAYTNTRGRYGIDCYAEAQYSVKGDKQTCMQVLSGATNSAGTLRLTADGAAAGSANVVNLPASAASIYSLRITVTAIDVTAPANTYSWYVPIATLYKTGAAQSTTALALGTPVTLATNSWAPTVSATADTTNGGLSLTFTTPAGNTDTIHIVARVESVEVQ